MACMASSDATQDFVILASFENRRAAEHLVVALGHDFRKKHRAGHAAAFVISVNRDGSLELTQSRVLSASGFVATTIRISLAWTVGFLGLLSTLRGGKGAAQEIRERKSHVGTDERAAHEILDRVGADAALLLIRSDEKEVRQAVVAQTAERASESWDGTRQEFLASLDPGTQYDWVRTALGEPS